MTFAGIRGLGSGGCAMNTARLRGWSTTAAYDAVHDNNRPTDLGAMQSCGPTLMAGAGVITMLRSVDIRRVNDTYYDDRKKQQERP
jgi:hypothetical protein